MKRKVLFPSVLLLLAHTPLLAMETLADSELSAVGAQAGLSVFMDVDLKMQALQWKDTTGISASVTSPFTAVQSGYTSAASLILGNPGTGSSVGVQICNEPVGNAGCTKTPEGLTLLLDSGATALATSATIRLQGNLSASASKIRVLLDKISLTNAAGTSTATMIDLVNNYFELSKPANPMFEVELGAEIDNGHFLVLKNADFRYVNFGEVRLCDKSDATCATQKMSFEFSIGDSATGNNGLNLSGVYADLTTSGMTVGGFSGMSSTNLMLNNIKSGSGANTMGGLGATTLNLSNMVLTFAGKS